MINSIRRIILSEIPNVAFKKVVVRKNNTNCHNEFIKHRILLPIFRNDTFKIKTLIKICKKEIIFLQKILLFQYLKYVNKNQNLNIIMNKTLKIF